MANCHDLFQDFYNDIKLLPLKKKYLKEAKDALRNRIKNYFKDTMGEKIPGFLLQGSYAMDTIITPLDNEFDIDDGVYLQNLDSDKSKWPTTETVHKWVYNAVIGHTNEDPKDKRTCVRVIYSGHYHVDLPIYCMYNGKPYFAEKGKVNWPVSDAEAIVKWFITKVENKGEQLRRIVRYLKAWADNK